MHKSRNLHDPDDTQSSVLNVLMSPSPEDLKDNPSLALLFAGAVDHCIYIEPLAHKADLLRKCDVIHIHWPEWLVRWDNIFTAIFDIMVTLGLVWLARRRGVAIVWTGHNLEPHEIPRRRMWQLYSRFFFVQLDLLISFGNGATKLLIERYPQLATVPVKVIPHGGYANYYNAKPNAEDFRDEQELSQLPVILSFGLIRPYKNIPSLIRSWQQLLAPRPQLLVAGRPLSYSLEAAIREEARGADDIRLLLRFIGEEEVPTIFSVADIVVVPYAGRSALNSGVAHLALSQGTAVVMNNTEANRELQSRFGPDWVWLCDGTADDALRVALEAIASPRPRKPPLGIPDSSLPGRQIWSAYRAAIAAR